MHDIKIGTKLKRLNKDYGIVEVIENNVNNTHIRIMDKGQKHYVKKSDISLHFTLANKIDLPEPDLYAAKDNNLDDPNRHSIAGGMNNPSDTQKEAFDKINKDQ